MKQRLFWKILTGFWITFILIMEGTWLVFSLYGPNEARLERAEERAKAQLTTLAVAAHYGGGAALETALNVWKPDDRSLVSFRILASDGAPSAAAAGDANAAGDYDVATDDNGNLVATVRGLDKVTYRINFDLSHIRARLQPPGPFDLPWELVVLGLLGGLAFSAILAWYLTRPIQRLRAGFDRLAEGHLTTRLGPAMGRRRDEIADLARDFDVMAAQLQQLVAAREQLLHDVSHELRSPLARLQVAIGLARQNPQRATATLERVEAEAKRLDELVGEVLTLSRAESGVPQLDDYFDLAGLVQKVVADARFEAQASGVQIAVEDRSASPAANKPAADRGAQDFGAVIQGNAELIRRALENIVRNALHHSKAGQRVTVAFDTDPANHSFVIRVADQGPGVAPEALTAIFDPFVRADARQGERAREGTGFGLGLAIAKRAVLAHGGSIEARNATDGAAGTSGLIVTIRLPFHAGALDVVEPA